MLDADSSEHTRVSKAAGLKNGPVRFVATLSGVGPDARHSDDALAIGVEAASEAGAQRVEASLVSGTNCGTQSPDPIIASSLSVSVVELDRHILHQAALRADMTSS
jgi:hypothetical protein